MWTDVVNNRNKFYILQVLESSGQYYIWTRYGRVGYDGVHQLDSQCGLEQAKKSFKKKYNQKVGKGYTEVKMAIGKPEEENGKTDEEKAGEESKEEDD